MTVHEFDAARAGEHDVHEWWPDIYRKFFVDYTTHDVVTDVALQKAGVDHRVRLAGGGEVLVDVKCRCGMKQYRDDVLVEWWSASETSTPGWARKPQRCHYLAYAWPQFGCVQFVPFHALRLLAEQNGKAWRDAGCEVVKAKNVNYTTVSVAVPRQQLAAEITAAMTVYLDDACRPF